MDDLTPVNFTPAIKLSRIATLDAVRGFAVMGILLLNIVDFGMPGYSYVDPNYYGGTEGANYAVWAINYVLFDGKMRGLFTMMFGASTVLIAERALANGENPAQIHYARMVVLFVIGMIHAYFIWYGDILVLYSIAGAVMFLAWRWQPRALIAFGIAMLILKLALAGTAYGGLMRAQAAAEAPGASASVKKQWAEYRDSLAPPASDAAKDLKAYRGTFMEAFRARAVMAKFFQTELTILGLPDTLGLMAIGMALFRLGFFSGLWSRRSYQVIASVGLVVPVLFYLPIVVWITSVNFSPVTLIATEGLHLTLLRPWMSLAWASLVILFVQSAAMPWISDRLSAAGRMAFSNYLGTSIICTMFFNGYGLGYYGSFERWQLYFIVAAVWALILLWSKPWLSRYRYGPFEWLWRSLSRWQLQPMRR